MEGVRFLLDQFLSAIQMRNMYGRLPLHSAILNGATLEVVRALLDARSDAISDGGGNLDITPVRAAARTAGPHQLEVLRFLVELTVNPQALRARASDGRTLLHDAVASGASADVLEFLLKRAPQDVAS